MLWISQEVADPKGPEGDLSCPCRRCTEVQYIPALGFCQARVPPIG